MNGIGAYITAFFAVAFFYAFTVSLSRVVNYILASPKTGWRWTARTAILSLLGAAIWFFARALILFSKW